MTSIASSNSASSTTRRVLANTLASLREQLKDFPAAPAPQLREFRGLATSPYYSSSVTSTMPSAPPSRPTTSSRPNATRASPRSQSRATGLSYSSQLVDADDEEEEPDELLDMYFWTEPPTLAYSNDPPSYAHACGQPEGHSSRKYDTLKAIAKTVSNEIFNGGKAF